MSKTASAWSNYFRETRKKRWWLLCLFSKEKETESRFIFPLYHNCISPQYLLSHWRLSLVIRTRVHMLNVISVYRIHTYDNNHHMPFYSFLDVLKAFFSPSISYVIEVYLCISASVLHVVITLMISNSLYLFILLTCRIVLLALNLTPLVRSWTCF